MTWHVEPSVWEAYVAGRLDLAAEASVETHVVGCAACRAAAKAHVAPEAAEAVWAQVRGTISAPPLALPLRVLRRARIRDDDLVAVSAADSLMVPWAVAVGFAVACACVVGLAGLGSVNRDMAFLVMAPLIPVLAVVAAFDALDPLREVAAPTPYSKLRLALLRATACLVVAVPATTAIGLVVPGMEDLAFVWLAPSLGLTVGALVLITWFEAQVAGAMIASLWVSAVVVVRTSGSVDALTAAPVQLACAGAGIVLAAALVLRTSTLRLQGGDL
jgi:hypothetical protein